LTPKFVPLASIWIVVAGTLWWYVTSRAAEFIFIKLKSNRSAD
jgi:hypothetical protein